MLSSYNKSSSKKHFPVAWDAFCHTCFVYNLRRVTHFCSVISFSEGTCLKAPPAVPGSMGHRILRFRGNLLYPLPRGTPAVYGDIAQYECPPGTVIVGDEVVCTSRRKWSRPSNIRCSSKYKYYAPTLNSGPDLHQSRQWR